MAATKNDAVTFSRMEVLDSVDSYNIQKALDQHVDANQGIKSDGFRAYNVVKTMGHEHEVEVVYKDKKSPNYDALKWINILVSNAKAFILGTYHGVKEKHLQRYLHEFCYRFNRRFWHDQGFDRLLLACANAKTVTFAELRQ